MKLWDKGISINEKIEKFTVGNDREIDIHIAKYDIQASKAHAKMLHTITLLSAIELQKIEHTLTKLEEQIANNTFVIEAQFEDVHSKIEFELTKELGDIGKKIHTARSRNDQVLVALHLFYKEHIASIKNEVNEFFNTLLTTADTHKNAIIPGYTHLQVAMPSSIGLWIAGYAELLIDDVYILDAVAKIIDQNPLGSAAGYGSSFPIDRDFTTKELGFSTLKYNVIAAQLGRGKNERAIANAFGSLCNTLSRFAMDICLYTSQNFGFISFPDELTTGSSIMPHKKNPDVFELIRGKCNKIQGLHTEILLITNNLPSGYHRDFQLLKEHIIKAFFEISEILNIFNFVIQQMKVNSIDLKDPKYQYLYTVDSINHLVVEGMPFRDAYQKVGSEVENNSYQPDMTKKHTHIGSIHNLCLENIKAKFPEN